MSGRSGQQDSESRTDSISPSFSLRPCLCSRGGERIKPSNQAAGITFALLLPLLSCSLFLSVPIKGFGKLNPFLAFPSPPSSREMCHDGKRCPHYFPSLLLLSTAATDSFPFSFIFFCVRTSSVSVCISPPLLLLVRLFNTNPDAAAHKVFSPSLRPLIARINFYCLPTVQPSAGDRPSDRGFPPFY